jgi:endonuclease YncB( thermonuclease family)
MAGYQYPFHRSQRGWPGRRQPFLLLIAFVCLAVFYAIGRRHIERAAPAAPRAPIVGAAWIVDGDSIRIGGVSIRLEGVDAPEWDQTCVDAGGKTWPCGRAATRELKARAGGRTLTCQSKVIDRYGRVIATCLLPDGSDVNAWLVREGWAVAYGFSRIYVAEEAEAKAARRGIWSGTFIYPSEWRRQKSQHGWRRWN